MKPELVTAGLTALLHASLLVSGAWFFLLTQRKTSAARRSLVCRLTLAATFLLTGYSFLSALPRQTSPTTSLTISAALPQGHGMPAENLLLPSDPTPAPSAATSSSPSVSLPGPVRISWPLTPALSRMLLLVWLAGSLWMSLLWFRSLLVRRRVLRHSTQAPHLAAQAEASNLPGWQLVDELRLIPSEITPCVWGLRKTILALPQSAATWAPDKLRLVLAHECAHLLRRDPLWQALTHAFLTLLWFHPLAWNLARRSQAADEQAADDAVLCTTPDAPTYAALLVECARHFSLPHPAPATTHAMATPANLSTRVEAILTPSTDRRPATFRSFLAPAVLIASIAAGLPLCTPGIVIAEEPTPVQSEAHPESKSPAAEESLVIVSSDQAKVFGNKVLLPAPNPKPHKRETLKFSGGAKFENAQLSIEADQMAYTHDPNQKEKTLLTLSATGRVVLKGTIYKRTISAVAEELWISNETGELILSGWPKANFPTALSIQSIKAEGRILLNSTGWRFEGCKAINPAMKEDPMPAILPLAPDMPDQETASPAFPWKPVKINDLEVLALHEVGDYYKFAGVPFTKSGTFAMNSNQVNIKGKAGSPDLFFNNVRLILKHPILKEEGVLYISRHDLAYRLDPVLRPVAFSADKWKPVETIILDPWHAGTDMIPGSPEAQSSADSLDAAQHLQRLLAERGIHAILTRRDAQFVPPAELASLAANQPNAALIRVHLSQDDRPGIKTFFPDEEPLLPDSTTPLGKEHFGACIQLATAIHANCVYKFRNQDGGIQSTAAAKISDQTKTPAILIECVTRKSPEAQPGGSTPGLLAEAIATGVQNYLRSTQGTKRLEALRRPGR